ncbi:hypothetical protein [Novosphingobium sp. FKTRR1]|nr:hypothetical protein [Novosphingobium sp. FKTRR1]
MEPTIRAQTSTIAPDLRSIGGPSCGKALSDFDSMIQSVPKKIIHLLA